MEKLNTVFLDAIKLYESTNHKITASFVRLEKDKLYNKIKMLAESTIERKLMPTEYDQLVDLIGEHAGNKEIKSVTIVCHPMSVLSDQIEVMFMRKNETSINLFILDDNKIPQLHSNFNQNSVYAKKLSKKYSINFTKITK